MLADHVDIYIYICIYFLNNETSSSTDEPSEKSKRQAHVLMNHVFSGSSNSAHSNIDLHQSPWQNKSNQSITFQGFCLLKSRFLLVTVRSDFQFGQYPPDGSFCGGTQEALLGFWKGLKPYGLAAKEDCKQGSRNCRLMYISNCFYISFYSRRTISTCQGRAFPDALARAWIRAGVGMGLDWPSAVRCRDASRCRVHRGDSWTRGLADRRRALFQGLPDMVHQSKHLPQTHVHNPDPFSMAGDRRLF